MLIKDVIVRRNRMLLHWYDQAPETTSQKRGREAFDSREIVTKRKQIKSMTVGLSRFQVLETWKKRGRQPRQRRTAARRGGEWKATTVSFPTSSVYFSNKKWKSEDGKAQKKAAEILPATRKNETKTARGVRGPGGSCYCFGDVNHLAQIFESFAATLNINTSLAPNRERHDHQPTSCECISLPLSISWHLTR